MARNEAFERALKIFKKDFSELVNNKLVGIGNDMSFLVAEGFVNNARNNLDRATPAPESAHLIEEIKQSISISPVERKKDGEKITVGHKVNIPIDNEGLVMFLEYGTGLVGDRNKHPQTDALKAYSGGRVMNWKYAVNKDKYRPVKMRNKFNRQVDVNLPYYTERDGKKGFVFIKQPNRYIDSNDTVFMNNPYTSKYSWVRGYEVKNKDGEVIRRVRPYVRYNVKPKTHYYKREYVFSEGLKPTRFIYDAKLQTIQALNNIKI